MYKFFLGLILFFLGILAFIPKAFAAQSLSATGAPSVIDYLQDFSLNVSLSCPGCSDSYLRGVFYPSGTSYFGYTQDNGGNWVNAPGSGCTSYFKIGQSDLQGGSWSGTLKFKPDPSSAFYNGPGEYLFKIGRYTSSCGSPSVWSAETTIAITGPTPTPSPSPTPSPTSTPTASPTSKPTATPTIKPSASPVKTITPSPAVLGDQDIATESLNLSSKASPTQSPLIASSSEEPAKGSTILIIFFIIGGSLLAAGIGYFAYDRFYSEKSGANQL